MRHFSNCGITRCGTIVRMLIPLALFVLLAAAQVAGDTVTTTLTIYPGWNLIGLPTVPVYPAPPDTFSTYQDGSLTGADAIDGNLERWNLTTQGLEQWNFFTSTFGNMEHGDGYWLYRNDSSAGTESYTAVDVSGDQLISLPKMGFTLVGYPNNTPTSTEFSTLMVTDGTQSLSIQDARDRGWSYGSAQYWRPAGGLGVTGLEDEFPDKTTLDKGEGYWFYAEMDGVAVIVPGL